MNAEAYNNLDQTTRGAIETIKLGYRTVDCYGYRQSVLLMGQPGVGKTMVSVQAAKELDLKPLVISPSSHDSVDIKLPYVESRFNFFGRKKTEYKVAAHAIGDLLPRSGRHLLIIDDITNCPVDMQATLYSLVYDGTLGPSYKIPEGSHVIACGNRVFDRCNAAELSAALKDRFITINVKPNKRIWLDDFAYENNVHHTITSWIEGVSEAEDKFLRGVDGNDENGSFDPVDPAIGLTPRSAYRLGELLKQNIHTSIDLPSLFRGVIGRKAGDAFYEYYQNRKVFDNVRRILNGEPYDNGLEYSTIYMITNSLVAAVDKSNIKNIERFFEQECDDEKKSLAAFKIHKRDSTSKLFGSKYFREIYLKNSNLIAG